MINEFIGSSQATFHLGASIGQRIVLRLLGRIFKSEDETLGLIGLWNDMKMDVWDMLSESMMNTLNSDMVDGLPGMPAFRYSMHTN
jgi:hypothetical protein